MAKSLLTALCLFCLSLSAGAYNRADISAERERVRAVYTSQIGVLERTNRNDGDGPRKYLSFVGLKEGNEWCSAFVSWCYNTAGIQTLKTGWAAAWYDNRHVIFRHGWARPSHSPQPGDLVLYYIVGKRRIGHVGFFDTYGSKYCITVEGNTNVGGRHGVHRIRRYWNSFYAIVDRIDS